jgi:cytidine deaminase
LLYVLDVLNLYINLMTRLIKEIKFSLECLDFGDLTREEENDLIAAENARQNAHAPYSNYLVGAAIRTNDNEVVQGWNVENIVYDGLHAEENAVGRIVEESRKAGLKRIAVVGSPRDLFLPDPVTPCGPCRQKLLELVRPEDNPMVLMSGIGLSTRAQIWKCGLRDLLPLAFYPGVIAKK